MIPPTEQSDEHQMFHEDATYFGHVFCLVETEFTRMQIFFWIQRFAILIPDLNNMVKRNSKEGDSFVFTQHSLCMFTKHLLSTVFQR